ncbi:MAG: methylmalonyl Co-A mutase-associated GTPase MeaB [Lentimicrobiaceae bacterium]|jgi:LAO/AO transport system kinase
MDSSSNKPFKSALKVNEGIEQPPSVNLGAAQHYSKPGRKLLTPDQYVEGITNGNRTVLSQAITLIESSLPHHQDVAQTIISKCLPLSGNSVRIGITGVPGVGKSTFIEAFGKHLTSQGRKIAVLAIDPSSSRSRGSILGDKTRMEELSVDTNAFIRPSPAAGSLGGVARKTRETIILCEAAGFDTILVETVGVGQSEIAVHSMVDFFLLLMLGGAGDELQGIKRGIMEMADAVIINKADGDNLNRVNIAMVELRSALHYFPPTESGWQPLCVACSSITKIGIPEIDKMVNAYVGFAKTNGYFTKRRLQQSKQIMMNVIDQALHDDFYLRADIKKLMSKIEDDLHQEKISAYVAAQMLLEKYFRSEI